MLTGRVSLPASLIGNNSGGLIGNNSGGLLGNNAGSLLGERAAGLAPRRLAGGRRLLATTPIAGATVVVVDAAGHWVPDPAGRPYTATTDAQGAYTFAATPTGANMLLQVLGLPAAAGTPTALLPAVAATTGQAARTVDVDATSTLTMGYITAKFVKGSQAVLDRLPAEVEADTRRKLAQAAEGTQGVTSLAPEAVVAHVDALRGRDQDLDAQVRYVESLLVAGLSNMGEGLPATEVSLAGPTRLAVTGDAQLLVVEGWAGRVRRVDAGGRIRAYAGGAAFAELTSLTGESDIGDGRPATQASFSGPRTIAVDAKGNAYLCDWGNNRIRRIDAGTGVVTTVVGARPIGGASRSFVAPAVTPGAAPTKGTKGTEAMVTSPHAIAVDGQGRCVFAVTEGTYRLEADGTLTPLLHGGKVRTPAKLASASDGQVFAHYGADGFGRLVGDAFELATDIPARDFKSDWHLAAAPDGVLYMHGDGALQRFKDGAWQTLLTFTEPKRPAGLTATAEHVWITSETEGGVWRLTPATGVLTRVAGVSFAPGQGLRGDQVSLNRPAALSFDASNQLLVADGLNGVIWRRGTDMLYRRLAGDGAPPDAIDLTATGQAQDLSIGLSTALLPQPDGGVIFSAGDQTRRGVFQVDAAGRLAPLPLPAGLSPLQIAKEASGAWLVSDTTLLPVPASRLVRVADGRVEELMPRQQLAAHYGLLPRPDGTIYWTDVLGGVVYRRDPAGATTVVAGTLGEGTGFGGDGGPATAAQFNWPIALAMDGAGHLYIADSQNHRVRRVDARTGVITTLAGAGGTHFTGSRADDGLREPGALAFDAAGTLYIADSGHNQIKRIPADKLPR
jgi:sugar lactone lactonase YvrE